MSVINKMLRDLDQRQAKLPPQATGSTQAVGPRPLASHPESGRGSVPSGASALRRRMAWCLFGVVIVALAGLAWSWQTGAATSRTTEATTPLAVAAPVTSLPASAAAPVVVSPPLVVPPGDGKLAVPAAVPPQEILSSVAVSTVKSREPASQAGTLTAKAMANALAAREVPADLGLRMESKLALPKLQGKLPLADRAGNRAKPDTTTNTAAGTTTSSGASPNDALERSQSLWNAGSREAAIDLLQDAVALAERQGTGASYPQGNPVLLPLVRELTRLQLAESRHAAVWELLARLEPQLGKAPDLWAIRGNAAQRLGRHQDSVHAYLVALQSRPNEQRWLLGAAVSLAALGQPSSAAEMADKARAVGTVSPDVLAYLRQQGVPLKDK